MIELVIIVVMTLSYNPRMVKDTITVVDRKKYETLKECERAARIINSIDPYEPAADINFAAYCEDSK